MKKTRLLYIVIALLVVSQLYNTIQIQHLKYEIKQNQNSIGYVENNLDNQISNIYSNVDRKMTEFTSLISACHYDIGVFDLETLTVPITFTIQPKTLTDDTRIFLAFDGEEQELKRSLSKFTLTKNCAIEYLVYPTIIIEENGTQQFEQHNDLRVYSLVEEVFPTVKLRFSGNGSKSATHYTMNGYIGMNQYFTGANNYFTDGKYVVSIDNKEVKAYEVTDFENFDLEIDDKFELSQGQKLVGKFIYTDKQGITYERVMFEEMGHTDGEPNFQSMVFDDLYTITAPDGRLIYKFDESNYEEIS